MALIKITDYTLHTDLDSSDSCYYLRDYIQGKGWQGGQTNNLILNLKKSVSFRNTPSYSYKEHAINQVAKEIADQMKGFSNIDDFVFCPIPPSKDKNHPEYDDRITQVLKVVSSYFKINIQEMIINIESHEANHNASSGRLSYSELKSKFQFDQSLGFLGNKRIILVDDMITNGRHFKVCKDLILENFPEINVVGLFVARRVLDEQSWSYDDFDPF